MKAETWATPHAQPSKAVCIHKRQEIAVEHGTYIGYWKIKSLKSISQLMTNAT